MNPRLVYVLKVCRAFGVGREDRIEWAGVVLNRHLESFKDVDPVEAERLVDAANGALYMAKIRMEYASGERLRPLR